MIVGSQDADGWRCIAYNPVSGVSSWAKPDGEDVLIQERQNVDKIFKKNREELNSAKSGWKGDGLHKVASIPVSMVHDKNSLLGGAIHEQDSKVLFRLLNDGDYSKLRTKEGNL